MLIFYEFFLTSSQKSTNNAKEIKETFFFYVNNGKKNCPMQTQSKRKKIDVKWRIPQKEQKYKYSQIDIWEVIHLPFAATTNFFLFGLARFLPKIVYSFSSPFWRVFFFFFGSLWKRVKKYFGQQLSYTSLRLWDTFSMLFSLHR